MPKIEESIVIDRPRQEVWDFATDPANYTLYQSNLVEFTRESGEPGPARKGDRGRGVSKVAGKRIEWTTEVTEIDEPARMHVRSVDAPMGFELTWSFEDVDGGTQVTFHQETESLGGFFGKLGDSLVTRMYAKDVRSNLENLKELMESGDL